MSKRGERTIRRMLILGASAVVRWASRRGRPEGSWLARMLARKPKMLVTVALANKTARIVWALLVKGGVYRAPGRLQILARSHWIQLGRKPCWRTRQQGWMQPFSDGFTAPTWQHVLEL